MKALHTKGKNTQVTHAGLNPDREYGSLSPPIYQTSAFCFNSFEDGARRFSGTDDGFIYTRLGNPTTKVLEEAVTILEGGYNALATASGMAAVTTLYMTCLEAGAHILGTASMYGPSRLAIERQFSRFGVSFDFIDTSDLALVRRHLRPETRLVFIETPSNPTLKLTDIKACAELAHEHGALLAVDNTFMSPLFQNPLALGADIVVHSMTKYLNGHSDVVAGILITAEKQSYERLRPVLHSLGGTIDPHQAWLVLRGLRTLSLRVERAHQNARILADFLDQHPKVLRVLYPGLPSHPQYELAQTQMQGFGSILSFEVAGGLASGRTLLNQVEVATLAVSLGGYETLIQHPASMTHAALDAGARHAAGISDGLVRLSVGCEDVEDLQADLDRCLAQI